MDARPELLEVAVDQPQRGTHPGKTLELELGAHEIGGDPQILRPAGKLESDALDLAPIGLLARNDGVADLLLGRALRDRLELVELRVVLDRLTARRFRADR